MFLFLQYINTGLLTLILTVVSIGASTMVKFNKEVSDVKTEQVRLKTIQDNTVIVSSELVVRVNALEVGVCRPNKNMGRRKLCKKITKINKW